MLSTTTAKGVTQLIISMLDANNAVPKAQYWTSGANRGPMSLLIPELRFSRDSEICRPRYEVEMPSFMTR
jgi:hypothetical protein